MVFQESVGIDIQPDQAILVALRKGVRKTEVAGKAIYQLDPGAEIRNRVASVADFLEEFQKEHRLGSAEIFVGVPASLVMTRVVTFPAAVRENLEQTLRYEMEKLVPLRAEKVRFSFQQLSEKKEGGEIQVLVLVAQKTAIEPYLGLADRIPGGISGIEPVSIAVSHLLGLDETRPDRFAKGPGAVAEQLIHLPDDPAGALSRQPSVWGVPAIPYGPAVGLALRGILDCPLRLNLVPAPLRRRPSRVGLIVGAVLLTGCLIAGLAWGGAILYQQRATAVAVQRELNRLRENVRQVRDLEEKIKTARGRMATLHGFEGDHIPLIDILRELTEMIPETAWIRDFSLTDNKIRINGEAETAAELIGLLENSPLFQDVVFRSAIVRQKQGQERFQIEMELEPQGE